MAPAFSNDMNVIIFGPLAELVACCQIKGALQTLFKTKV